MSGELEPWVLPQETYDWLMSLPDGTDISEHIVFEDPEWQGFTVTKLSLPEAEAE